MLTIRLLWLVALTVLVLIVMLCHVSSPRFSRLTPLGNISAPQDVMSVPNDTSPETLLNDTFTIAPKRHRDVRMMFIGDSITEGLAPGASPRFRAPADGSCSFRFRLIGHIVEWLRLQRPNHTLRTVGSYSGVFGAALPMERCCSDSLRMNGATESCEVRYGKHSAVFGAVVHELFYADPHALFAVRARLHRSWFKRHRGASRSLSWALENADPLANLSQPAVVRWCHALRPHWAMVAMGTNDLGITTESATEVCQYRLTALIAAVLYTAGPAGYLQGDRERHREVLAVSVATLLWRVARDVEPVNRILRSIGMCKNHSASDNSCALCVQGVLRNAHSLEPNGTSAPLASTPLSWFLPTPLEAATLYCDERVFIMDLGGSEVLNNETTSHHFYDGIHPSAIGEERLAARYFDQLQATGMLQYVFNDV